MKTRLKEVRKELKMTQREFASKTNIDQGQLSRYEREEAKMSAETVYKICKALDISSDYFLRLEKKAIEQRK